MPARPATALMRQRALSAVALMLLLATATACPDSPAHVQLRALSMQMGGAGTGSLSATPAGPSYADGATVSIAALPATGSVFSGWTGECAGSANPCSVIMSDDRSVTGWFRAATGAGQFDGSYSGTWSGGQSDGAIVNNSPITWTLTGGGLSGDSSPNSGSTRAVSGTVSATGAVSASIPTAPAGCAVSLTGQITTPSSGPATGSGTYLLIGSATCHPNTGTWTVTRLY